MHLAARMLKGRRGNTGGDLYIVMNRKMGRAVQHELNSGGPRHIGNLMGIGDECRHAGAQLLLTVDLWQRHRGLHMTVGIDKPGRDIAALQIKDIWPVILADARNPSIGDRDIGL